MRCFFFLFVLFCFPQLIFSQRVDFSDSYNYDLQNRREENDSTRDFYKEYKLPPKPKSSSSLTPKTVQKPLDPTTLIPQGNPFRRQTGAINPTGTTTGTPIQNPATSTFPINPLTGEINTDAILKNQADRDARRKQREKFLAEFEKPDYQETPARRKEIIFFMTFPFAFGVTALATLSIEAASKGFAKSSNGSLFLMTGSIGLSALNVWFDSMRYDTYLEEKKRNPGYVLPLENRFLRDFDINVPFITVHF